MRRSAELSQSVNRANSATTVEVLRHKVTDKFGYLLAIYNDDGTCFKGDYAEYLHANKVKQIYASPWYPSSVGLAERYVHLVRVGLQKAR